MPQGKIEPVRPSRQDAQDSPAEEVRPQEENGAPEEDTTLDDE